MRKTVVSFPLSVFSILLVCFVSNGCYASDTPRLGLSVIPRAFPQMHVPINENTWKLDALIFPILSAYPANANPALNDPVEGDLFIVPSGGEGDWSGHKDDLAVYQNAAWAFIKPLPGMRVVSATDAFQDSLVKGYRPFLMYDGSAWTTHSILGPTYFADPTANNYAAVTLLDFESNLLGSFILLNSNLDVRLILKLESDKPVLRMYHNAYLPPDIELDAAAGIVKAANGFQVGTSTPYTGTIPAGKRPVVQGGIVVGVAD